MSADWYSAFKARYPSLIANCVCGYENTISGPCRTFCLTVQSMNRWVCTAVVQSRAPSSAVMPCAAVYRWCLNEASRAQIHTLVNFLDMHLAPLSAA